MSFYELRQYHIHPGMMDEWVKLFEEVVLPFQIGRGIVFAGSFRDETDETVFIWMRRFESEAARERIYRSIYEDADWKRDVAPHVSRLMDREKIQVRRLHATAASVIR